MARKPLPPLHIHLHLHPDFESPSGEVHLHLHPEGKAPRLKAIEGPIEAEAISLPAEGVGWPVRPDGLMSSPFGYICIYGYSDTTDPDEVWGKVFDHEPTDAEKASIPGDAVQGALFTPTGELDFKFDHLTQELGSVLHSSLGEMNWIVVWVRKNGSIVRTFTTAFRGITAAQTFCELLSGGSAALQLRKTAPNPRLKFDEEGWQAMVRDGGTLVSEVPGA